MRFVLFLVIVAVVVLSTFVIAVEPFGGVVNVTNVSRAKQAAPEGVAAWAGNVTEVNIHGFTSTQSWQGYYGNVTGVIILGDSAQHIMYNWTDLSPRGELYASTNTSISWGRVQCFNYTSTGTKSLAGESAGGEYSLSGTNLTELQYQFNISGNSVDSVNNTFRRIGAEEGHQQFYTNNIQFSSGKCQSARVFDQSGEPTSHKFEEALLYEPSTTSVIFAALLERDVVGFQGGANDFEMLVLENGHGTDTLITTYYFYVELE